MVGSGRKVRRVLGALMAGVVGVAGPTMLANPPAMSAGRNSPPVDNGSFEAPDLDAWRSLGDAAVERTRGGAFHGAHVLNVTVGSLSEPSGVATTLAGSNVSRLMTLALKGTATSAGKVVDVTVTDPMTGERTTAAPVHLQPWWQTVGITIPKGANLQLAIEAAGDGWSQRDTYVVDAVDAATGPRSADVQGRQLFVDGQPYVMHGYTYGAAPVGSVGLPAEANNVLSFHTNPEHCRTDANLMRAAGVNTLRITFLDVYDDNAIRCMDEFAAAGIGLLWLVNGPGSWQGTDLPAYEEGFRVQLALVVGQVKDHRATLGYVIGNENSRTQPHLQAAWFGMLDRLAAETKQTDPNHLATVSVNSQQFFANGPWGGVSPTVAPNVDLWGFNGYGNGSGYPSTLFSRLFDQDPSRPVWMSEFGTDRYRCAQHAPGFGLQIPANFLTCRASGSFEDQQPQAAWDVAQWQDIAANLSSAGNPSGTMVGGTLFMWSDMWWFSFPFFTGSATTPLTHDVTGIAGTNPINGQPNNFIRAHMPDQHFSPEWIGVGHVLRVDQTGPRVTSLAYDAMAVEYTGTSGPQVSGPLLSAVGACSASISWTTDVPAFSRADYGTIVILRQGDFIEADNTIADQGIQGSSLTTAHQLTVDDLVPATAYRAHVRGFTADGRSGTSTAIDFTTAAAPDATCS